MLSDYGILSTNLYLLIRVCFLGQYHGTCKLLENHLNKNLLYLACRHHVYELVLRSAAETCWPATLSLNVAIFIHFQTDWSTINQDGFETGIQVLFTTILKMKKKTFCSLFQTR